MSLRSRLVLAAALCCLLSIITACDGAAAPTPTPNPPSGIRGMVILGPTCPVESEPGAHEPVPCLTPYSAQLVVVDARDAVVARTTSGADGRFEVELPPGDYVVSPQPGDPLPIAQPVAVSIAAGEFVEIEINYDTGIR